MSTSSRGDRFIAAFNDIADRFRQVLGIQEYMPFAQMVRKYADKQPLPSVQRDALLVFANLRNAISHGRYYDGQPIAEPVEAIVAEIERLRDQILSPPEALAVLEKRKPCVTWLGEPIGAVLQHVVRFDYSQIPVYESTRYKGILTTNAIARWLADRLAHGQGLAEHDPVSHVLPFAEPHECALFVDRKITAAEAIEQLTHGGEGHTPVTALIATADGSPATKPIRVISGNDLPALSAELGIGA